MESSILLSELNDFIFCPRSIYWHHIYGEYDTTLYHTTDQVRGSLAHAIIDEKRYSSRKTVLQGTSVFSEIFGIMGKIDLYDTKTGILTERKRKIHKVYQWYYWQLYGQYFCLREMGYVVTQLRLHSLIDNKNYYLTIPDQNDEDTFRQMLDRFRTYQLDGQFKPNRRKCERCIYRWLCDVTPL